MTRAEILQKIFSVLVNSALTSQYKTDHANDILNALSTAGVLKVDEQSTKPFNPFAGPEVGKSIHEQPKEPSAEEKIVEQLKGAFASKLMLSHESRFDGVINCLIEYFQAKVKHD